MREQENACRILWRPKAEADLNSIIDFIAAQNPARAESFGLELRNRIQRLAQHPGLGRQGRPGLPAYVRELVIHPNYILFYRLMDQDRTVEILRLKHARQKTP